MMRAGKDKTENENESENPIVRVSLHVNATGILELVEPTSNRMLASNFLVLREDAGNVGDRLIVKRFVKCHRSLQHVDVCPALQATNLITRLHRLLKVLLRHRVMQRLFQVKQLPRADQTETTFVRRTEREITPQRIQRRVPRTLSSFAPSTSTLHGGRDPQVTAARRGSHCCRGSARAAAGRSPRLMGPFLRVAKVAWASGATKASAAGSGILSILCKIGRAFAPGQASKKWGRTCVGPARVRRRWTRIRCRK
jgi:hypothetical protein